MKDLIKALIFWSVLAWFFPIFWVLVAGLLGLICLAAIGKAFTGLDSLFQKAQKGLRLLLRRKQSAAPSF